MALRFEPGSIELARAVGGPRALQTGPVRGKRDWHSHDRVLPTGDYRRPGIGKDFGREACLADRRSKSALIDLRG